MENIAKIVEPIFDATLNLYDFSKYPSSVYNEAKEHFPKLTVSNELIERSLLWKWGHVKKDNYPQKHKELIAEIQAFWPEFKANLTNDPELTFNWWQKKLVKKTRYISIAYLTHLIHNQSNLPIIDQHNFRAMNDLFIRAGHDFLPKKKPSNWDDIVALKKFMAALQLYFPKRSFAEIDRFLMMYGRYHAKR
ncbi:hypothetical protein WG68_04520 [Arsukibacterium ikkense]|uniref:Uncharacterized protein n=1 Tax=Arsukibacterium ikkense TaxID=336831 RepID=A0A0M2V7G8_9GAMM|nr:hypothetical protein [Arsukibacterium ikkense]KKO46571.1 hypothetical protein WG68_04520 [Arsukibacterium ikkense]